MINECLGLQLSCTRGEVSSGECLVQTGEELLEVLGYSQVLWDSPGCVSLFSRDCLVMPKGEGCHTLKTLDALGSRKRIGYLLHDTSLKALQHVCKVRKLKRRKTAGRSDSRKVLGVWWRIN